MGLQHTRRLGGGGAARKGVLVSVWVRGNQRGFGSTHGGWGGGGGAAKKGVLVSVWVRGNQRGFGSTHGGWGGGERQKKGCWSVFGCEGGRIKGGLAADMTRRHKVGGGRGREYASARVSAGSVGNCGEEGRGPGGGGNQGR